MAHLYFVTLVSFLAILALDVIAALAIANRRRAPVANRPVPRAAAAARTNRPGYLQRAPVATKAA